ITIYVDHQGECQLTTTPEPCTCPRHIRKVCGTDGNTYQNQCLLQCAARDQGTTIYVDHQGECQDTTTPEPCNCPHHINTVCGTDGNTYPNECLLDCTAREQGTSIRVDHDGECQDTSTPEPCNCPRHISKVCGTDGNTYQNPCLLECAAREQGTTIYVDHQGECQDTTTPEPCNCPRNINTVCGTDGNTYPNQCLLECTAREQGLSIRVDHQGECQDTTIPEPCNCPHHINTVCGTDGNTYPNECLLDCTAREQGLSIRVDHQGECQDTTTPEPCNCPHHINTVCGTDGNTYQNECLLECTAREQGIAIHVDHQGACHVTTTPEPCACPRYVRKVCGTDGNTYLNPCLLECAARDQGGTIYVDYQGACQVTTTPVPCTCPRYVRKVCGTDGNTYLNPCLLECAARDEGFAIYVDHQGACEVTTTPEPCTCPRYVRKVCGTDGNTYLNPCLLECASKEEGFPIYVDHQGACQVTTTPEPCACPRYVRKVCGTNGKTYLNQCLLECAASEEGFAIYVDYQGACQVTTTPEPCACPRYVRKVCGTDGNTYLNPCLLECAAKDQGITIHVDYQGECHDTTTPIPCTCPRYLSKVCGTDGITYQNPCLLECASREQGIAIGVNHQGECQDTTTPEPCVCTHHVDKVCGTDGNTYLNPCLLECAARKNYDNFVLVAAYSGECGQQITTTTEAPCFCPRYIRKVCGSDASTYQNECELACAARTYPGLIVDYEGECGSRTTPEPCTCPKWVHHVCGTDGRTYLNTCALECEKRESGNYGITVAHDGPCGATTAVPPNCNCPRHIRKVCGSDGETYLNACQLQCTKTTLGEDDLRVVHRGECREDCACGRLYRPVCGSNGRTYNNLCLLECDGRTDPDLVSRYDAACLPAPQFESCLTHQCEQEYVRRGCPDLTYFLYQCQVTTMPRRKCKKGKKHRGRGGRHSGRSGAEEYCYYCRNSAAAVRRRALYKLKEMANL
ncbi:PREDICTED: agrin-like, partial [Priapulus caudatus]|uniref:Agrin-like n=1 Tax=Priapulus caudatus TaxID=37621 RepID=A0ABM1EA49_PRICU